MSSERDASKAIAAAPAQPEHGASTFRDIPLRPPRALDDVDLQRASRIVAASGAAQLVKPRARIGAAIQESGAARRLGGELQTPDLAIS